MTSLFHLVMALTFLTANVNGLHDSNKWTEVWQTVPRNNVICLQEIHLEPKQEKAFTLYAQGYDFYFSHGTSASAGLCVIVKHSSGVNVVKVGEIPRRLIALDLKRNSDGLALQFVGIYAPNDVKSCCDFFTNCTAFFCGDVVLGGDFNLVIEPYDRLSRKLDGLTEMDTDSFGR